MKTKTIDFDLKEYLRLKEAGEDVTVKTQAGRPVRIVCTNRQHVRIGKVIALIQDTDGERITSYHDNGRETWQQKDDCPRNLKMVVAIKEVRADDLTGIKIGDVVYDLAYGCGRVMDLATFTIVVCFCRGNSIAYFNRIGHIAMANNIYAQKQTLFRTDITLSIPMVELP